MSDLSYVSMSNVTRQWNGKGGVVNVSFDIPIGEFVSILGPSGCGKSTLLRLISGLEMPQSGSVTIAGREVNHVPPSQRGLSMVFQSYALFPHLNVRENVMFGMRVRRIPKNQRESKLTEAVKMVGLEGHELRKPAELSGGQRQRVALARAVVSGHPLCLMDEPLSNLDAKLRHSVRRDIKSLQRRLGLTVVYVTHDQSEAMSLSDMIILMRDGQVEQIGSPQTLYTTPESTFAAEFIGDPPMAIVEGGIFGLPGKLVGMRPEHLIVSSSGTSDLTAIVHDVEYMGANTHIVATHEAARGLVVSVLGHSKWRAGQEIDLKFPMDRRVLFDAKTGIIEKDPQQDYGATHRQTAPRDGRKAKQPQPLID